MKTEAGPRRVIATRSEIAARVNELAPRFLEGFIPSELATILDAATLQRFKANTVVAREEEFAGKLFMILEGRARTFTTTRKGEKLFLFWIPPGDVSGGRAMLSKPAKYLVCTETAADSLALVWNRAAIVPLAKQYPRLLENALLIASDYVELYRDLHISAVYQTASQRLSRVLDGLSKVMGQRVVEGIELNINNEDLANEANITIFTVSRLLNEWQRKGLLLKGRGRVVLRSTEELVRSGS